MARIIFKGDKVTSFLGRNGKFKCSGVDVWAGFTSIWFEAVTSQGITGRCYIEIPVSEAGRIAKELTAVAKAHKEANK